VAENGKNRFPQIPATVWWGVRAILTRTPTAVFDERFLAIQLNVQEVAAKQYIAELTSVGILNDEKKATPLALEWRLDSSYRDAVDKLVKGVYPKSLLDIAPPEEGNRQKATSFFMSEGLGQGAAGNKAATYFMIGSPAPNESPARGQEKSGSSGKSAKAPPKPRPINKQAAEVVTRGTSGHGGPSDGIPLNVNVQIHISADATSDQIESIFSAMRRYLYDKTTG
jgi:hypothetical protein